MSFPSLLDNRPSLIAVMVMLILISLIPLGVSTVHLGAFFAMCDRGLPYPFVFSLAVALEAIAILTGIIATSIGKASGGSWPAWTATSTSALLIWAGNAYVMQLAAPTQPWFVPWVTAAFALIFTAGLGAVLGMLLVRLDQTTR